MAPFLIGAPHQSPAGSLGINFRLEDAGDFLVGEHICQTVGAEQHRIVGFQVNFVNLDFDLGRISPDDVGDHVAQAMLIRILG